MPERRLTPLTPGARSAARLVAESPGGACPVCGSGASRAWRTRCRDFTAEDAAKFRYDRCLQCRVAFLVDPPTGDALAAYYRDDYGPYKHTLRDPHQVLGIPSDGALPQAALARRVAQAYLNGEGREMLDFGCGSAQFLDAARALGWRTTGVDFSDAALERARLAGHAAEHVDQFLAAGHHERFDALHMSHVVEHVAHPREVLARVMASLCPGAQIHISTPDPDSVGSLLFRRYWFPLEAPRHLVLFPPSALVSLLVGLGAEGVTVVHEPLTKDLARSLEYAAAPLLRHDRTATGRGHGSAHSNRAASPLSRLADVTRRTDRYHVFAVRG